jgi:replicative DNA helicase
MTGGVVLSPGHDFPRDRQVAQLRVPPHSIEAESSVLGGLLLDNNAFDRIGDLLTDSDFYRYEHRLVFAAIGQLIVSLRPADQVTVYEHLQKSGKAEEVGGLPYLNALAQFVPSAGNIRRYAQIVRERAILRRLVSASDEIATAAFNPGVRTVADIVDEAMRRVIDVSPDVAKDEWEDMDALVVQQLNDIQARCDAGDDRDPNFIPTGIRGLDDLLDGGMRGGQYIVIAARPSIGKSALADVIGRHVAINEGLPVAKFSMEMQNSENAQRAIAATGRIPLHALRRPKRMSDFDWSNLTKAVETLRHARFYSNQLGGLNINQVRAKARALKRKHGIRVWILDYLQLMSGTDPRVNRTGQLEEVSRGIKALAKELGDPIIALAQVKREVEERSDPMPGPADIKDCGSIEQDADIIIGMDRPAHRKPDLSAEWKHYAKAHLSKQRGGRTGYFHMLYEGQFTHFADWPEETPVPQNATRTKGGL